VATGEEERGDSGSSQSRSGSETPNSLSVIRSKHSESHRDILLALVYLDVPLAPGLGRSEHATATAHVTESSLAGTVSTTTGDTGNTGNGTTCNQTELASHPR
jgi:hypothetical protein